MGETESQAPDGAKATRPPQARSPGRRLPFALLVVFTALCAWWTHGRVDAQDAWTTDALLLPEDRLPDEIVYLRLAHEGVQEDEDLRAASLTLDRERPGLRVPIAAPPGEIGAWLDAHALYLLPVESHEALAARFEDEAMTRAVQELRAHLNSPFFGLMDEQARRDPLGVRPLLAPFLGASERGFASKARVTSTGDLLSADSSALLIELRSSASAWELERELEGVLADALAGGEGGPPIELRVIDPHKPDPPPRPYEPYLPLVAIAFVAFAVERRMLAPLLRLGVAALAVGVASGFAPAQAPFEFPLYCALLGTAYWLAGPRTIDSYAPVIFGVALAPLIASVYPGWAPWASAWILGCLAAVGGGFALRKRLELDGDRVPASRPSPVKLGVATGAVLLATVAGSVGVTQLAFEGTLTTGDAQQRQALRDEFFDPSLVVRSRSRDDSQVRALARAAEDHPALRHVADAHELRLDGPGAYVLAKKRLEARRESLRDLRLRARMQVLRNLLETEGFRPEAFSEFLDTSARLNDLPDAQAALDGNLGPWIESRSYVGEGLTEIESLLYFNEVVELPVVNDSRGEVLELHGPAVSAATDRSVARGHLLVAVAISCWLASLLSFVARRHFPSSLLVGCAGFISAALCLGALAYEGVAPSAELFPPLLVVMALAQAECEAAIEKVSRGHQPSLTELFARVGPLLALGLLCLVSPDAATHTWGLILAVGGTLGVFVAHVLAPILAGALHAPREETAA